MYLKRIFSAFIAISLIVTIFVSINRISIENKYNTVEIVGDLSSFEELSSYSGENINLILDDMKKAGLNGVAVNEVTLDSLQQSGIISLSLLKDIENLYLLTETLNNKPLENYINKLSETEKQTEGNYIVVTTKDKNMFEFLKNSLSLRVEPDNLKVLEGDNSYAFVINKPKDLFITKGLGFDQKDLELVKSLKLDLIPRIENFTDIKDKDILSYVNMIKKYNVKTVIFSGSDVLGNPAKISYAAGLFRKNGINTGIIDVPMGKKLQDGMNKFAKFDDYRGIKVFGLSDKETQKYEASDIVSKWFRGILDRNVRIIYMRAKIDNIKSVQFNIDQNISLIKSLNGYIEKSGLKTGIAKPLGEIHQSKFIQIFISFGIIAGGLLILYMLGLSDLAVISIGLVGQILTIIVLLSRFNDLGIKVLALSSSVIFPSLAIGYLIDSLKNIIDKKQRKHFIIKTLKIFIYTLLISSIGALYIASIMADSKYMLKLDYFRGVKFSFILPLIYYFIYFIFKFFDIKNGKDLMEKTKDFLMINIKIWHVIVFVIAVLIGVIYISRTGNNPIIPPTSFELKFRDILEHTIIARPRTKEFLIGDPAIILAIYAAFKNSKGWTFIFGIFSSIGILSIVNTFSHIESVMSIAIERTILGWVLGAIIGLIFVYIIQIVQKKYLKRGALL